MTTGRRDEIAARAAELFAQRGFYGVSVSDIGGAVGLSGPALYRHFDSKQALFDSLLVDVSERLVAEGRRRREQAADPRAGLEALVAWHVDFARRNRPLIVIQDRDWDALSTPAQESVRRWQLRYIDLWVETLHVVRPRLERPAAEFRVRAVYGLINATPRLSHLGLSDDAAMLQEMALAALLSEGSPG